MCVAFLGVLTVIVWLFKPSGHRQQFQVGSLHFALFVLALSCTYSTGSVTAAVQWLPGWC